MGGCEYTQGVGGTASTANTAFTATERARVLLYVSARKRSVESTPHTPSFLREAYLVYACCRRTEKRGCVARMHTIAQAGRVPAKRRPCLALPCLARSASFSSIGRCPSSAVVFIPVLFSCCLFFLAVPASTVAREAAGSRPRPTCPPAPRRSTAACSIAHPTKLSMSCTATTSNSRCSSSSSSNRFCRGRRWPRR